MLEFIGVVWALSGIIASCVVARSICRKHAPKKKDCDTCAVLKAKGGDGMYDCPKHNCYFRRKPKYCSMWKPREEKHE